MFTDTEYFSYYWKQTLNKTLIEWCHKLYGVKPPTSGHPLTFHIAHYIIKLTIELTTTIEVVVIDIDGVLVMLGLLILVMIVAIGYMEYLLSLLVMEGILIGVLVLLFYSL